MQCCYAHINASMYMHTCPSLMLERPCKYGDRHDRVFPALASLPKQVNISSHSRPRYALHDLQRLQGEHRRCMGSNYSRQPRP